MLRMLVLVCLCLLAVLAPRAAAQDNPSLAAGSIAPPLSIDQWPRGVPVTRFERGRVYVVEFWATWCTPCHLVVPKLTELQRNNPALTVIAVAGAEQATSAVRDDRLEKVQDYITKRHEEIGFTIAYDGSGAMWRDWMVPAQRGGIPAAFIVGPDGRLTWIGNPLVPDFEKELAATLARSDVNRSPSPTRYIPGTGPQQFQRPVAPATAPSTTFTARAEPRAAMPRAAMPRDSASQSPASRTPAPRTAATPREIRIEFVSEESGITPDPVAEATRSVNASSSRSITNPARAVPDSPRKPTPTATAKQQPAAAKPTAKTANRTTGKPAPKPTKKTTKPEAKPAATPSKR